jgi:hypothetical protein
MGMARAQVADREIAEKAAAADPGGNFNRPQCLATIINQLRI